MSLRYYTNAPATTLATSVSSVGTSIQVTSITGLPIQYPYILILERNTPNEEVVLVNSASGSTLSVTRGFDGTTAFSHSLGTEVVHGICAIDPREANAHVNASSGVHGVAGSLVGSNDIQTLSNKTLGASNVINGFTASRFMEADGTGRLASGSKTIPTGAVVGTTDAQTLSNKTLTSPAINGGTQASPAINTPAITAGTYSNPPANIARPVGEITMFAGAAAPTGWAICDGTAVSRTTFAALFALIGTTYGAGDGVGTFNLPDLRGRGAIGVGTATGAAGATAHTLGQVGGEEKHTLSTAEMPAHSHGGITGTDSPDHAHTVSISTRGVYQLGGAGSGMYQTGAIGSSGATSRHQHGISVDGGNAAHNNMQPYVAINYIIKTQ